MLVSHIQELQDVLKESKKLLSSSLDYLYDDYKESKLYGDIEKFLR